MRNETRSEIPLSTAKRDFAVLVVPLSTAVVPLSTFIMLPLGLETIIAALDLQGGNWTLGPEVRTAD